MKTIYHSLSANDMILFLFSNVDYFICKKLGHFIFLAFVKRELNRTLNIAAIYVRIFRVIKAITGAAIIIIYNNKMLFPFSPGLYFNIINIVLIML